MELRKPDLQDENQLTRVRALVLLPLLVYPVILLVSIMTIASPNGPDFHQPGEALGFFFIITALLYPVTVFVCLRFNRQRSPRREAFPLIHLALTVLLGAIWFLLG